jgi:hypothetical protein
LGIPRDADRPLVPEYAEPMRRRALDARGRFIDNLTGAPGGSIVPLHEA